MYVIRNSFGEYHTSEEASPHEYCAGPYKDWWDALEKKIDLEQTESFRRWSKALLFVGVIVSVVVYVARVV